MAKNKDNNENEDLFEDNNSDLDNTVNESLDEPISENSTGFSEQSDDTISEIYDEEIQDNNKKKTKKRKKKARNSVFGGILLITVILAISAICGITIIVLGMKILGVGSSSEYKEEIDIPDNYSTMQIAELLKDEGIIDNPILFRLFSRLQGGDGNYYPGIIEVYKGMPYSEIIDSLTVIREIKSSVSVTFVEGVRLYDAAKLLEEKGVCSAKSFIFEFNNTVIGYDYEELIPNNKLKFYKMEGYLFPDTYEFYIDDTPLNVIKKIAANFNEKVNNNKLGRMKDLGLELDEVITLASIVQAEAGVVTEMKKVASVFTNRLNNSDNYPLLQSDPTSKYVKEIIKPNIEVDYEEMFIAYDTYLGNGLPPGAICNPGIEAIDAILYPVESTYYFFCANINTREFFYAETNAGHEANLVKAGLK